MSYLKLVVASLGVIVCLSNSIARAAEFPINVPDEVWQGTASFTNVQTQQTIGLDTTLNRYLISKDRERQEFLLKYLEAPSLFLHEFAICITSMPNISRGKKIVPLLPMEA